MPPKKNRISREMFLELLPKTKSKTTRFFNLSMIESETPRFSVVIPKKLAPKATLRNYIKRKIYHVLTKNAKQGIWIVFAKKPITDKGILEDAIRELSTIIK